MKVLLIGSGGREHAMAWKLAQSPQLSQLYIAPGNAGTSILGTNVDIAGDDFNALGAFAVTHSIDMVVVGPEDPLVKGIYDYFKNDPSLQSIPVIGPSKEGARLEGSKDFAKTFMQQYNIPTARYLSVSKRNLDEGKKFLTSLSPPYVLKADGLAAGKGVLILHKLLDAQDELENMLGGRFGAASNKVVIEEFLSGIELSVFVLTDGKTYKILPEAKDYKRIGEGDTGLNTGGMGAISPVPFADKKFIEKVETRIIKPTIDGLQQENIDFKGFIFIGLMNCNGEPYVIEYNVRMGDPETEAVFPRIKNDMVEVFEAVATEKLSAIDLTIQPESCTTVMLVSGGYPGSYKKGKEITGLDEVKDVLLFHAGTKAKPGQVLTNGGRVLSISALGSNMSDALARCYLAAEKIGFEGKYYRKDIGFDL
ncbi:MAG: phosphoribosylamine--glycine ligase [Bacteroidetes bacterium]|jgi:phosphoribosylamine--glycine ligase|nr:phosphoribosylamine--glycine ligase [Bacteroidota bacterium]